MQKTALTRQDIHRIVGDVDDETATAIMATGASPAQLEEAIHWASGESDAMGHERKPLSGTVAALYDILNATRDFADNDR